MELKIRKAERKQRKARIAIAGPSGSGKTMTALRLAQGLKTSGRILVLDTERASSTLYADKIDFDQVDLPDYEYETFLSGIKLAAEGDYDVLIIDSVSHAWESFLEAHGKMQGNSFTNWAKITPKYNDLIRAMVTYPGHIIATMRAKTEYVLSENDKGKQTPQRVGMGVIMRPGSEYEFDVVMMGDVHHNFTVEKTRLDWLADKIITKPGEELGKQIREWLDSGKEVAYLYRIDSLSDDKKPQAEIYLKSMGAEWLQPLGLWKSAKELPKLVNFLVKE